MDSAWSKALEEAHLTPIEMATILAEIREEPTESVLLPLELGRSLESLARDMDLPPAPPFPDRAVVLRRLDVRFGIDRGL